MHLCKRDKKINGAEGSPETDPYTYGHLIYNRDDTAAHWGKDAFFNKLQLDSHTLKGKKKKGSLAPISHNKQKSVSDGLQI